MFTGIIVATGTVKRLERHGPGRRLQLLVPREMQLEEGESIAVNGVCLTVIGARHTHSTQMQAELLLDVSPETLVRTNLRFLRPGERVNLEPPLTANGRFAGHIVLGHVDALGRVLAITKQAQFYDLNCSFPPEYGRYLVEKGAIAVDGISLTAYDISDDSFHVAVIPYTYTHTNLHDRRPGDPVNLEFDILGKYVAKLLAAQLAGGHASAAAEGGIEVK